MHTTMRALPLIAAVLAALAGCGGGPSDSPERTTTSTTTSTTSPPAGPPAGHQPGLVESSQLELDDDGCPILPHGWNLCADSADDPTWSAPLKKDGPTWQDWVSVGFFSNGTMTWQEQDAAARTGTWTYDGADAVVVHFDATVPMLGTDTLTLTVGEFRRGCGDPVVYYRWDSLTSTQPALRFEPIAC